MQEQVIIYTILTAFAITVILSPIFIPFLRKLKFGQSIREEGPKSHQKKSGTPTMGGIMILLSIIVTTIVMTSIFSEMTVEIYLLLLVTIGFGILGFLDDFIKVALKRNLRFNIETEIFRSNPYFCHIFFYLYNHLKCQRRYIFLY